MILRSVVVLLLLVFLPSLASAQSAVLSNDYWLSYLPSLRNGELIWALVSTNTPGTRVKITYSEDGSFDEFTINPNQPKEYRIKYNFQENSPYAMAKPTIAEVKQKRSIHIQSSAPIAVQQFTDWYNNVSLSLPVPSAFLGRNYIVAAYNDQDSAMVGNSLLPRSSGEFIVIAPEDSTNVTIIPSGKTSRGLVPGDTARIMLQKGETYWVKGLADSASNDLSGTRIISDKPVSIVSGAETMRAADVHVIPGWDYNDHISEYMLPIEQWGTDYIISPLSNKKGLALDTWGDLVRIFAAEETHIYVNGVKQQTGTRWDFANLTEPLIVSSTKPIMVVQYDYLVDLSTNESGKPRTSNSMMVLQPMHQWVKEATATIPERYERTYYYVTAHTDSLKLITTNMNGGAKHPIHSRKDAGTPIVSIGDYSTITLMYSDRGQVTFSGPCQFSVRNHGTWDDDQITTTYSYGAVTASTFGRLTSSDFTAHVDSLCGATVLHIEDTSISGDGIADIQLVHIHSSNVRLIVDPYPIGSKHVQTRIEQVDPSKAAKAGVLIRSREGTQKTVMITLPAHTLSAFPVTEFKHIRYGDTACKEITITNSNTTAETIAGIRFKTNFSQLTVTSDRAFPFSLLPGETFVATLCYAPNDTGSWISDTLIVDLECSSLDLHIVRAIGKSPLIYADDRDFKVVELGRSKQENIKVMNEAYEVDLTIAGWDFSSSEFSIDSSELLRLPITLRPREHALFPVTYKPIEIGHDTAVIIWHTDILYGDTARKSWSMLVGSGEAPRSVERLDASNSSIRISDETLQIQLQNDENFVSATLFDIAGREYRLEHVPASIDNLPAGVYMARVTTSKRTYTEKLLLR